MPQFTPGKSGNPAGRRPGAVGLAGKLREALAQEAPAVIASLLDRAKQGDVQAASLILARVLPPLRPVDEAAPLPPGIAMGDLSAAPQAVLEALASGVLTPSQGLTVANALAALVKVRESTELESRIAALEENRHAIQP